MTSPASTGLSRSKLLIAMVGLPARGKSYVARKLGRYLGWIGHATKCFNVGTYRRSLLGAGQPHAFFAPENLDTLAAREHVAQVALDDALGWLAGEGTVALYDATNTTRARRAEIAQRVRAEGHELVFVESICDDPAIIDANVRATKLESPDYVGSDPDHAVHDFHARIGHYARVYETMDAGSEPDLPFVQIVDLGREIRLHKIDGYLPARIVYFLVNAHPTPHRVWLTRHGQSVHNLRERIGGDAPLTARGEAYAKNLGAFAAARATEVGPIVVWTSTLHRAVQTGERIPFRPVQWKALDEIDAGVCDGMTYDEIARAMPDEYAARASDKFGYRYPRGESYQDVIERLEPVIIELERQRAPLLIVGHQAVLRVLYGYLMDRAPEICPRLDVPLHTVIELVRTVTGCDERRHPLGPAVDPPLLGD